MDVVVEVVVSGLDRGDVLDCYDFVCLWSEFVVFGNGEMYGIFDMGVGVVLVRGWVVCFLEVLVDGCGGEGCVDLEEGKELEKDMYVG